MINYNWLAIGIAIVAVAAVSVAYTFDSEDAITQESAVVVPAEAVAETTSVEPQVPDAVTGEAPVEAVVTEEVSAETAPTQ
jgi:hypothetical protein